jgi:outer membrane protein TolC
VGLQLDLPIDRVPDRNTYRATLVSFEAEIRNLKLTLDNLKDSIDRGLRTLEQRRQNYYINKSAAELAEIRVKGAQLQLEAGRIEPRQLLDALDNLVRSRNAVVAALVDYQQTRLQLMLDIGALESERPKFWLADHLATFMPNAAPAPAPADINAPVVPPEVYFEKGL